MDGHLPPSRPPQTASLLHRQRALQLGGDMWHWEVNSLRKTCPAVARPRGSSRAAGVASGSGTRSTGSCVLSFRVTGL